MWVIHSLRPETDLKPHDLRKRLIDYVRDPLARHVAIEQAQTRAQSEFERKIIESLIASNYRAKAQVAVGYYRIDIVVYGRKGRVALECDGDRYHPVEKIPEDMARQAILERLGWRFIRVRGSQFFRDRKGTMSYVYSKLQELGIDPIGPETHEESPDGLELKERVIRRAFQLRREWQKTPI
jgi:very-short-patch-repair endonuclease